MPGDTADATCGSKDGSGFVANDMCCGCGGGQTGICTDTNIDDDGNTLSDAYGDACDFYAGENTY